MEYDQNKIIFFGHNIQIISYLFQKEILETVILENERATSKITEFLDSLKINWFGVTGAADLESLCKGQLQRANSNLGLSYGFGIIFKESFFNSFNQGIINIHPGSFAKFRGRHAIQWAIFENESEIIVTCHLITEKIDAGPVVYEASIPRMKDDNVSSIEQRIEDHLVKIGINEILTNLKNKNFRTPVLGVYRQRFPTNHIYDSFEFFDFTTLFNLFKTQESYSGITYRGRKYTKCSLMKNETPKPNETLVHIKDGIAVILE